jgi:hypothetical protein
VPHTQEGLAQRVRDFITLGVWSAKTQAPKRAEGPEPRGRTLGFKSPEDLQIEESG